MDITLVKISKDIEANDLANLRIENTQKDHESRLRALERRFSAHEAREAHPSATRRLDRIERRIGR